MDDTIYRQAAIKLAIDLDYESRGILKESKCREIENRYNMIPPAQPERKKGKWIRHTDWEGDGECAYECSVCGMGSDVDYDFCMRCGADMRGGTT